MENKKCFLCSKSPWGGTYYQGVDGFKKICWECYDSPLGREYYDRDRLATKNKELMQLIKENKCSFDLAYVGYCGDVSYPFCEKHKEEKCSRCGEQATRQCSTAGSLVCGAPICDKCEHCR